MEPLKAEELDEKYIVVNGVKIRYIVRSWGLTNLVLYHFKGGLVCWIRQYWLIVAA